MARLKILTLNAGLAVARLFGKTLYTPAPFVDERAKALPDAIAAIDADVIVLQEVYEKQHRRDIVQAMRHRYGGYAHSATCDSANGWGLMDHGLLILSQIRLEHAAFIPFQNNLMDDSVVVRKGFLGAVLHVPCIGRVLLLNGHTTAGGLLRHPESVDGVRQRQIDEMLHAERHGADHVLLTGDLNAGPGVSDANYRSILAAGFTDAYAATGHDDLEPTVTWDPTNLLNATGPHRTSPPQRINHVFVRSADDIAPLRVAESAVVLHAPSVEVSGGNVTVSDHYGFTATLQS